LNSDPDDIIKKYGLGFHSRSFNQMVQDISFLINNPKMVSDMGKKAKLFAMREFDIEAIVRQIILIIENQRSTLS